MPRPRRPWTGLLALLALASLTVGCAGASTRARIRQLDAHEKELRASVSALESKQAALRQEIERSRAAAEQARCQANQEAYRAVVAGLVAEYSVKLADHKSCRAESAKGGGVVAAAGCGLATFLTGGLALAVCGGAAVAGLAISEGSCSDAPPRMTPEDIRRRAQEVTGHPREPTCQGSGALASNQPGAGPRTRSATTWGGLTGTELAPNREPQRIIGLGNSGLQGSLAAVPSPKERRKMYRKVKRAQRKAKKQAAKERRRRR